MTAPDTFSLSFDGRTIDLQAELTTAAGVEKLVRALRAQIPLLGLDKDVTPVPLENAR